MPGPNLKKNYTPPRKCQLRVLASDPSQSQQYSNVGIIDMVCSIPSEENLARGPEGKYLEVIDLDISSGIFYPPMP